MNATSPSALHDLAAESRPSAQKASDRPRNRRLIPTLTAGLAVLLLYASVAMFRVAAADGNYTALLHVSERAYRLNAQLRERMAVRERIAFDSGYDAQYTYFATFDPLMQRFAHVPDNYRFMMDSPQYRFGRIGHVWLTWLGALGDWRNFPVVMVWTVLLGCAATAVMLSLLAVQAGRSPWWGLAAAAIPGFWQSVQVTLPEPIAAAAVLAGFWLWKKNWIPLACIAFAAALLVRETSALAIIAVSVFSFRAGRSRAGLLILASAIPLGIWKIHVGQVLFPVSGWEGFYFNPGTLSVPFSGIAGAWSSVFAGTYFSHDPAVGRGALAFGVLLCAAAGAAFAAWWRGPRGVAVIAMAYALVAVCLDAVQVWVHVGNAQRTSVELFVWLAVVGATWPAPSQTVKRISFAVVTMCVLFALFAAHDASTIREALWPW